MRASIAALCFLASLSAAAQTLPCPGGRLVTGFALTVASPGQADDVPFAAINNLGRGDILHYAPEGLPAIWRRSARVAAILIPAANDASAQLAVFNARADRPVAWTVPAPTGAVAFLFGPDGLNAKKTRSLLTQHPEMVMHFIEYAEQASRVEALVALLARYENSPPGSLDLNQLLKNYSAEYGVTMPKANPALPPEQEAAILLAAVAPPTAQAAARSNTGIAAGSTSTATALADLYYGPIMGVATDTLPLFRALHSSLFPGTQFQGAFAQAGSGPDRLCAANMAPPPNQHTVYIWMSNLPGGAAPTVSLAKVGPAVVPSRAKSTLEVTCASVAQLRNLTRARQWTLVPATGAAVPVPVHVATGPLSDTLDLDLARVKLAAGDYQLTALWDWTPVHVQGTVAVRPPTGLAQAKLDPASTRNLTSGGGKDTVIVTGGDFAFVNKVALTGPSPDDPAAITFTLGKDDHSLTVTINTAKLAPGVYRLELEQTAGQPRELPLTILSPDPSLDPVRANLGEGDQRVTLRGEHLDRVARLTSPDATFALSPLPPDVPANGLAQRAAVIHLDASAQAGQSLPASIYVTGRPDPLLVPDAVQVLEPRPRIGPVNQTINVGETVALQPGELPSDATVNFAFNIQHAPPATLIQLRCQSPDDQVQPLALHAGEAVGPQELDSGGNGLFYLALVPGKVGAPGCNLQMVVADAADGDSDPSTLGRVVELPHIHALTLSNQSPAPGEFSGELSGDNLQLIAKTGWSPDAGVPVASVPMRVSSTSPTQTLAIVMPWPPPSPHAPLYIWLHGETKGRATTVTP